MTHHLPSERKGPKSKALANKRRAYDKWNTDKGFSSAGSRRDVKRRFKDSSEFPSKKTWRELYKRKKYPGEYHNFPKNHEI